MKILISRPDKIGDVVLALHGVKQLKKELPHAKIYMHTSPVTMPLVKLVKFVDGCVGLDEDLSKYKFDAAVDLMAKSWTSKIYSDAKIPLRIGNSARWFRFRFNRTHFLRRSRVLLNEAQYNWQLMRLLSPKLKNTALVESLTIDDFDFEASTDKEDSGVILMPGVTASAKAWEQPNWVALAKILADSSEKVTILLGPDEKEQVDYYNQQLGSLESVSIKMSTGFPDLLNLLASAKKFVGPSTGITHLASALKVPGVALYSVVRSMHPRRWQPFNSSLRLLSISKGLSAEEVDVALRGSEIAGKEPLRRSNVSGFVICMNEERKIRRCLDSLSWCDELVIVDSGSTDKTLEICREYTDKIFHRDWTGHRDQKQYALEQCSEEWVVNIDADEEISMELQCRIEQTLSESHHGKCEIDGFNVSRVVYFLNRWWDKGGWYPEYRLRFFRRNKVKWGGIDPHEKAVVNGKVQKLFEPIYHYTYEDITHQIRSTNSHSSLSAQRLHEMGVRSNLIKIVFHPIVRFFKFYLLKLGFRHGFAGLIVAMIDASSTFLKYTKLWELQQNEKKNQLVSEETKKLKEPKATAANVDNISPVKNQVNL